VFVSNVYSYLIANMHSALNATFTDAELPQAADVFGSDATALSTTAAAPVAASSPAPLPAAGAGGTASATAQVPRDEAPLARCLRIAYECEFSGSYGRAARAHQTRVALAEEAAAAGRTGGRYDASVWHDYGAFLVRRGLLLKAVACFREAVSIDPEFVPSLLALAATQCVRGQAVEAGVMAGAAVTAVKKHASDALASGGGGAVQVSAPNGAEYDDDDDSSLISLTSTDFGNLLPLALGLSSLIAQASGGRDEDSAEDLAAALRSYRALLRSRGIDAEEAAATVSPGSLYLLVARYALQLRVTPLARLALSLAEGTMLDASVPRVQRAELLTLQAAWFLATMRVMDPREVREVLPGSNASAARHGSVQQAPDHIGPVGSDPLHITGAGKTVAVTAGGAATAYDGALQTAQVSFSFFCPPRFAFKIRARRLLPPRRPLSHRVRVVVQSYFFMCAGCC
jgi:hypothetical protein